MGSPISGSLSNLFIHMMKKTIINKLIKEKTIVHYQRYADDVLCICLKNSVDTILNKMNSWDGKLSFTVENLVNNVINFLDARIFIENRQIKLRKFFKKAEKRMELQKLLQQLKSSGRSAPKNREPFGIETVIELSKQLKN